MLIIHVHVHVKTESIEAFREASLENARNSIKESGIARFDVLQQSDDPARFLLIEVYRSQDAPGQHRSTAHYEKWRDIVTPMMAEPRTRVEYQLLTPDDDLR